MHTEVDRTRLLGSAAQSLPATCRTLPDAKRPYLDWRLFSLLRHLCDSLKVTCFELDARKRQEDAAPLRRSQVSRDASLPRRSEAVPGDIADSLLLLTLDAA